VNKFEGSYLQGLIEQICNVFQQTVYCDEASRLVLAIWAACTWFPEQFDFFPRLYLVSVVKGSGKTTCLEVLNRVSYQPIPASSISEAAIYRILDKGFSTLLLDEVDNMGLDQRGPLLRILNAGHQKDGFAIRCGDSKQNFEAIRYKCSGFVAFAGIDGFITDTLLGRSIQINLVPSKKTPGLKRLSKVDSKLIDSIKHGLGMLRDNQTFLKQLKEFEPSELYQNRTQDNWEPLMKVAGVAGKALSSRLFEASHQLESNKAVDDEDVKIVLLTDIRRVFYDSNLIKIHTSRLVDCLSNLEDSRWSTYNRGRPLNTHQLTKWLRSFKLKTERIKVDGKTSTGYRIEQFDPIWDSYLPSQDPSK
tara:strand:- start:857 stop:1942 length:1086 start_codon:yes stop_codon:yes gene_type:complete